MTKTRVAEITDAHHFLERARDFLFSDELGHNLLLSSALSLLKVPRHGSVKFLIANQDNEKRVTGAAIRSPTQRWVLSANEEDAAQTLITQIPAGFRSVTSDRALEIGATNARQNLMALKKLGAVDPAPGLLRFALSKDLKILSKWSGLFADEAGLDETRKEAEDVVQKYFESKQLYVWDNGVRPVAMAAVGGFTPKAARISMVYTDLKDRGHNYATTLVHRVAHRLQNEGRTPVLLCDSQNKQTNYIYEKIGFKTLKTLTEHRASKSPDNDLMRAASSR